MTPSAQANFVIGEANLKLRPQANSAAVPADLAGFIQTGRDQKYNQSSTPETSLANRKLEVYAASSLQEILNPEQLQLLTDSFEISREEVILDYQDHDGLTNDNFKISVHNKSYMLRLPGAGTQSIIDREQEQRHLQLINDKELDAHTVLFDTTTGMKVTEFIEGKTFHKEDILKHKTEITHLLWKLHHLPVPEGKAKLFLIRDTLNHYEDQCGGSELIEYPDYSEVKSQILGLLDKHCSNNNLSLCHNDLVSENLMQDDTRMYLIDWEYSGLNDPLFDIAACTLEAELTADQTIEFLTEYLGHTPTAEEITRVHCWQAAQDLLWSVWAVFKTKAGKDNRTYGEMRFKRACSTLQALAHSSTITQ